MPSPHYPTSNGFIERSVQKVKITMKKVKRPDNGPELPLLCMNTSPKDAKIGSLANLLYNRNI